MRNVHLSRDRGTGNGMCGEFVRMALPRARLGSVMHVPARSGVALVSAAVLLMASAVVARQESGQNAATASSAAPTSQPGADGTPVRIDTVVTDTRGRPVSGLRASDFQLLENGTAQTLTDVEFRTVAAAAEAVSPIVTDVDEVRAARQPGTRVFAFFLDDFHVAAENAERARDAVARFIDEQLQPQDLAIVMRPLDPLRGLRFTRDRAALHAALAAFSGRKGDLTARSSFEESASAAPRRQLRARARRLSPRPCAS